MQESKLKCEMKCRIWKKGKSNSDKIWGKGGGEGALFGRNDN
jgi:hypothetical protein